MAANASAIVESAQRFGRDIRALRDKRGVTLEHIHKTTKVPEGILETFESDALVREAGYNKVYVRSIGRSYARILKVKESDVLTALDEVAAGMYVGSLAVKYLGATALKLPEVPPKPATDDEAPAPVRSQKPPKAPAPAAPKPAHPSTNDEATAPPSSSLITPKRLGDAPKTPRQRPPARKPANTGGGIIAGIVALVVVVAGGIWYLTRGPIDADVTPTPVAVPDTQQVAPLPPPVPEPLVLGDSISVMLIAARDKLERIRVTVDDNVRRPYWREQGDTLTFTVADQIVLESNLPRLDIYIESFFLPIDDSLPILMLTRADMQAHIDTVSIQ